MLLRARSIAATAQDCGRFESSALPPSQTPQFNLTSPNHQVLSAHSFRPRPPTSPGSGREERVATCASTSQSKSSETRSGTSRTTQPDRPGFPAFAVIFRGRTTVRNALFPGQVRRRAAGAHSLAIPARVRHASEGATFFQTHPPTTATKCMAHKQNNKTARIDLDITVESQQRFAAIHKASASKQEPKPLRPLSSPSRPRMSCIPT
jgi:hypothetical protein